MTVYEPDRVVKLFSIQYPGVGFERCGGFVLIIHTGVKMNSLTYIKSMDLAKEPIVQDNLMYERLVLKNKPLAINYPYDEIFEKHANTQFLIVKRAFDIIGSLCILLLSIPVSLLLALLIKLTSPGSAIYIQTRIGRNNRAFGMYKFRSMYVNAETGLPVCASKNDPRITSVGRWMRRTHLDEIPNLLNVLMGEMSLVGPRPERQYFIDKIVKVAPEFRNLLTIKPGVTSWGQIKFGYAENVDEMVTRMQYDLKYVNHNSLLTDIIILFQTLWVVIKG